MKKEKKVRKKHPILKRIFLGILVLILVIGGAYGTFGGFGTGPCANTEEFAKYATTVDQLTIPETAKVIALGEATHGNSEFQQLKLDVFKVLVEKFNVKAFVLEGDFGGCETVNRYIQGMEDCTAAEAVEAIGFSLYCTDEMAALVEWMKEYNATSEGGLELRFYGCDMQRYENNVKYLLETAKNLNVDTSPVDEIWDAEAGDYKEGLSKDEIKAAFENMRDQLSNPRGEQGKFALHFAEILLQNIELGEIIDSQEGIIRRDAMMAENIDWIKQIEMERGYDRIFYSAHNGHVEQNGAYNAEDLVTGGILAKTYGEGYYAIGTDFYKTKDSLRSTNGQRINRTKYSYDPLAKASMKCGYDISYLDFSAIPEDSELYSQVHEYTWMGSLGELTLDFVTDLVVRFLPMTYRVYRSPAECYDSMIFVSKATPFHHVSQK